MSASDTLYKAVGARIRAARGRGADRLSQASVAKQLGISRASVVNIEAGRQHAPLSLLWEIAEVLDTELSQLIPRRSELITDDAESTLSSAMREQIKQKAAGDDGVERDLSSFVAQLLRAAESSKSSTKGQR